MSEKLCQFCKSTDVHSFTLNIGEQAEINHCNFCGHEWTTVNSKPAFVKKKKYKVQVNTKPHKQQIHSVKASIDNQRPNYLRSRTRRQKQTA